TGLIPGTNRENCRHHPSSLSLNGISKTDHVVDSRTRILDRIRSARVPKVALPDLTAGKIAGDNLQMFSEMLVSIGGSIFRVGDYAEVQQHIVKQYAHASRIISVVPDLPWFQSNFSSDPHDFQDVDLVVMNGHFAVAEN